MTTLSGTAMMIDWRRVVRVSPVHRPLLHVQLLFQVQLLSSTLGVLIQDAVQTHGTVTPPVTRPTEQMRTRRNPARYSEGQRDLSPEPMLFSIPWPHFLTALSCSDRETIFLKFLWVSTPDFFCSRLCSTVHVEFHYPTPQKIQVY